MSVAKNQTLILHGHSVTYVQKGAGPVLLLIHGIAGSLETWRSVVDPLARNATVLAVDLPGHGASSPGGGDYSLGSLAAGLRDVLTTLGHDRATLIGHSLGGGIAMQFSYQFPEMTERLVLVSSGGLGLEVNPALRAASLPGANLFLSVTAEATRRASGLAGRVLRATHSPSRPGLDELVRSYASLADADRRSAFLAAIRSVVGLSGQTVRAGDRLYLAKDLPVLLIWGAEDPIIPVEHARAAHELLPDSTLAVFDGVRHFPHVEAPQRFVETLEYFCATTDPVVFDAVTWRARMRVTQAPD
ncbi:MAG TPA: alpha/beta fold hydrolase [Solirubrobacteraceae bacterium]|nr:alpha/beta fold hydrolase [Solirubrobacteraceae bacterium]